jgi:hypothetical protein|tara:strand:+ start:809 stop:1195 length:387 start_codon:yes stop_codon:yes gene_type:complete
MGSFLYLFIAFLCGVVFNIFWGYILGLGYGIMSYQQTTADCIRMLAKNVQSVYELQQLKYIALEMMDRDVKYIEFQRQIDKTELKSMKNTVIRNYINSTPRRFSRFVEFHDWDSAMNYLNDIYNGGRS